MKKLVATTMMDKTIEVVRSNKCPALTSVYFKGMGGGAGRPSIIEIEEEDWKKMKM